MREIEVATAGTIARDERCLACLEPMLYVVDDAAKVRNSFCGNVECHLFLVEIEDP